MGTASRLVLLAALALAGPLAGCASTNERAGERVGTTSDRERYLYYAKAPVPSFSTFGRIDGWKPLGGNELIIWTRFNEAYLVTVEPNCLSLGNTMGIAIESRIEGTVSSGFDSIRVGRYSCRITQIRPIDYRQMRADERELREGSAPAKADAPAEEEAQAGAEPETESESDEKKPE